MLGYSIASKGRPASILLIEDNYGDVLLIRKAIAAAGLTAQVDVAEDGQDALNRLRRQGNHAASEIPDIILLDINLPGMSGVEVLRSIKEDRLLRRIPVIVMSSSRAHADIARCYDLYANGYMIKPDSLERLTEVIRSMGQFWFTSVLYAGPESAART